LVGYGVAASRRLKHQQVSTRVPSGCQIFPATARSVKTRVPTGTPQATNTGSDQRAVFIGPTVFIGRETSGLGGDRLNGNATLPFEAL